MKKIVIIGGGISGFVSAINAKDKNNEVIILEGGSNPLKNFLLQVTVDVIISMKSLIIQNTTQKIYHF